MGSIAQQGNAAIAPSLKRLSIPSIALYDVPYIGRLDQFGNRSVPVLE
jgi:hypothetical protein